MDIKTRHRKRFEDNIKRVDGLITLYDRVKNLPKSNDILSTDILRAAVVFLHASQEDYIRSLMSEWLISKGGGSNLEHIPLMGSEGRAEKFSLEKLRRFSDWPVKKLLEESVAQAMSKRSFNQYSEITASMKSISISLRSFDQQKEINDLIQRRHKIVHEVDQVPQAKSDKQKSKSLQEKTVRLWKEASEKMIEIIDKQVANWIFPDELRAISVQCISPNDINCVLLQNDGDLSTKKLATMSLTVRVSVPHGRYGLKMVGLKCPDGSIWTEESNEKISGIGSDEIIIKYSLTVCVNPEEDEMDIRALLDEKFRELKESVVEGLVLSLTFIEKEVVDEMPIKLHFRLTRNNAFQDLCWKYVDA
jgi:hypothetical protein